MATGRIARWYVTAGLVVTDAVLAPQAGQVTATVREARDRGIDKGMNPCLATASAVTGVLVGVAVSVGMWPAIAARLARAAGGTR